MIVGAAEGLIISVITQPCLLIPGISRHRNTGDVVLVVHETLSGILEGGKYCLSQVAFGNCVCNTENGDLGKSA